MRLILFFVIIFFNLQSYCQPKTYYDYRKNKVYLPQGNLSFADQVVSFKNGTPKSTGISARSSNCLGEPNFKKEGDFFAHTSLGCGGTIILKFTDNALVDVKGPDLYIFEVGISVEPTNVSISKDGINWISVGDISGGMASVDISSKVKPGDVFNYVRLIDLKVRCGREETKGADIDAVAAIGAIKKVESSDNRKVNYKTHIETTTDYITVELWDNEYEDGDTITLKLNSKIVLYKYRVTKIPKKFKFQLTALDNDLIMYAENLGTKPPNTAAFKISYGTEEKTVILTSNLTESEAIKITKK